MLQGAVESVLAQKGLTDPVEVIVVDNDPQRSAEHVVENLAQPGLPSVRYLCEARAGISHARNAGVAASRGRYIAFLDDDEVACPRWLAALHATAEAFDADIVVGPVVPRFADTAPISRYAARKYNRDAKVATGSPVAWFKIGNALLHRGRCFAAAVPFDLRFGLSGGEDTILMAGLREQGRRLVWCAEAVVTENIPEDKVAPAYLLRRAFRAGQTTAYVPTTFARPKWGAVVRWMVIGAAQVCIFGPWSLVLRLLGREAWLPAAAAAASGLGKLLWLPSLHIRNYQRVTRPARTPRHIRDVTRPFRIYFRRKRMRDFLRRVAISNGTTIIDVGGTPFVWRLTERDPSVTIVNLKASWPIEGNARVVLANGLALPFRDRAFDVCFSNSVIEHVGDARARANFAREVRRVANRYWVQTPNRRFPLETHFVCLFLHWLPFHMTRRLIRHFSLWGWLTKPSQVDIDKALLMLTLLEEREMRELFPDATIIKERFLGMVKSLIAVRP